MQLTASAIRYGTEPFLTIGTAAGLDDHTYATLRVGDTYHLVTIGADHQAHRVIDTPIWSDRYAALLDMAMRASGDS